jgi:hypothetical protein
VTATSRQARGNVQEILGLVIAQCAAASAAAAAFGGSVCMR